MHCHYMTCDNIQLAGGPAAGLQDLRNLSLILLVWDTQLMRANRTGTLQFTTLLRLLRLLPQLVHHLRQPASLCSPPLPCNALQPLSLSTSYPPPPQPAKAPFLRPLPSLQAGPSQALLTSGQEAVDMWRCVAHHPGLVCPRAAFVSDKVGSRPALYFVHDHMPGQHSHVCVGLSVQSVASVTLDLFSATAGLRCGVAGSNLLCPLT